MSNQGDRKRRIDKIYEMIKLVTKEGKTASFEKLIAYNMVETGISKRVLTEYIDMLVLSGRVNRDKDDLWIGKQEALGKEEVKILDENTNPIQDPNN